MYRFFLDIPEDDTYAVTPRWDQGMEKSVEPEGEEWFFRERLTGKLTFQRADFDLIDGAAFDTVFGLTIETDATGSWVEYWTGSFTKTDCEFDDDNRTVEVQPDTSDAYRLILEAMDKEFDLIELGPKTTPVTIRRQPLIQVYFPSATYLTNFIGGTYWEQPVETPTADPLSYGFAFVASIAYIPGVGSGISPDVAGAYDGTTLVREDNIYYIEQEDVPNPKWQIKRVSDDFVEYETTAGAELEGPYTVTGGGSDQVQLVQVLAYARYLTNETTVDGTPTDPLPDPDILAANPNYTRYLSEPLSSIIVSDGHTDAGGLYGKFADDAIHFAGEYFTRPDPTGLGRLYPINRSEWQYVSIWLYFNSRAKDLQELGSTSFILRDAFRLSDVLDKIVTAIDPTVTHAETSAYSFLYDAANAIRTAAIVPMIAPKTNVTIGEYDQPARRAPVKLSDILQLIRYFYNAGWYIDSSGRFRIEHVSFFENGGTYSTPVVGVDLTTQLEPKTGKAWGHASGKYKFEKADLPEEITFRWMDDVSPPFLGYPIVIRSNYVQKGNRKENVIALFTSDVDYMLAQPDGVSKDGFVFLEAVDVSGDLELPFIEFTLSTDEDYKMQNGYASMIWGHDAYHRHGAPAPAITLNGEDITATSVQRRKVQEVEFGGLTEPDPLQLVTTSLGTGRVKRMSVNLSSRAVKMTINHDNE